MLSWWKRQSTVHNVIAIAIIWLPFKFADPFGLESATRHATDDVFTAVAAPFHGVGEAPVRDKIAVVLVTDATIEAWGHSWPVPFAKHARALEDIEAAGPRAIFVDYRFQDREGDNLAEFADLIAASKRDGIPLLFARGAVDDGFPPLPAPLTELQTVTGWDENKSWPLQVHVPAGATSTPSGTLPTAAYELYRQLCRSGGLPCREAVRDEDFTSPLLPRYGIEMDTNSVTLRKEHCPTFGGSFLNRLESSVVLLGRYSIGKARDEFERKPAQPCPLHLEMDAGQIGFSLPDRAGVPVTSLLRGRVVFYGDGRRGEHDTVTLPLLGQVPGVEALAIVFDNLLLYGRGYFKPPRIVLEGVDLSIGELVEVFTLLMLIMALQFAEKQAKAAAHGRGVTAPAALPRVSRRWIQVACGGGVAVSLALIAGIDAQARGLVNIDASAASFGLVLYGMAWLVITGTLICWQQISGLWLGRFVQALAVIVAFFVVNEALLHWPNADWVAFVVIYFAVSEIGELKESRSFGPILGSVADPVALPKAWCQALLRLFRHTKPKQVL